MKKNPKEKDTSDSEKETDKEHFNFEHLNIGVDGDTEWGKIHKEWLSKYILCVKCTFNLNESHSIIKIKNLTKKIKIKHYMPILVG